MEKFVPLSKKSKKEQKKFYAAQRRTWNGLNPVTRTVPNGKADSRKKYKNSRHFNDECTCCFFVRSEPSETRFIWEHWARTYIEQENLFPCSILSVHYH